MGANDKAEATYHGRTPDTEQLRDMWVDSNLDHLPRTAGIPLIPTVQAEFDRWLGQVKAEAKAEVLINLAEEAERNDSWDSALWIESQRHYITLHDWLRTRAEQIRGS